MTLPEIVLDDRSFQDLVNEARRRISRTCPEWSEHNVSDPGITLIESFAWMTEMLTYRINRVPEKLHLALLDLLGIRLDPPSCAACDLRFLLVGPAREAAVVIPAETEVGTRRTAADESIVFRTAEPFTVEPLRPKHYVVGRPGALRDVKVAKGHAKPTGDDRLAFGSPPAVGDALHLGFDAPLDRLVMRIDVECSTARGAGVDPEDPPLRWEVSGPDGEWIEAEILSDTTGGFNYGSGAVELQLPARSTIASIAGHRCHWIRCRVHDQTRDGGEATLFSHPPEVYDITAAPIGALLRAAHAAVEREEPLGESDGTPGQRFVLRHSPVLALAPGERLETLPPGAEIWQPWEPVESFVASHGDDRHFVLDLVTGEIELGPAIREVDGRWRQHGAIPEKGTRLRFSSYRRGGGRNGNVTAGSLTVMRTPLPGVTSVVNPGPARGGVDAETVQSARHRAPLEIRSRYRAVTAEDFEFLAYESSPRVARAVCVQQTDGHAIHVHLVPQIPDADRALSLDELTPDEDLLAEVGAFLDERRLIGTTVRLLPASFKGVSVVVNLEADMLADPVRVEQDAAHALATYLNPLIGGDPRGPGAGWRFGGALNTGELYGIMHAIDGVEQVRILRVYETDLATGEQSPKAAGNQILLEPTELIASANHIVKATHGPAT